MPKVLHGCKTIQAHTDPRPTKSDGDSAENLIDGAVGKQSLSLATDKADRILKMLESQSKTIYDKK